MAIYHFDIELTTGDNDGSSAENAWQSWEACLAGLNALPDKGAGDGILLPMITWFLF